MYRASEHDNWTFPSLLIKISTFSCSDIIFYSLIFLSFMHIIENLFVSPIKMISNTFVAGPVIPNLSDTLKLKVISADTLEVVCLQNCKKDSKFIGNLIVWDIRQSLTPIDGDFWGFVGSGTQLRLVKLSLELKMQPAEGSKGVEVHLMFFLDLLPLVERRIHV